MYKETYFWCWAENEVIFYFLEQVKTREVSEKSKDIILELNCDAPVGVGWGGVGGDRKCTCL